MTDTVRVRRALSPEELTSVLDAVQTAGSAKEILAAAVEGVFTALLNTVGESLAGYGPDRRLNPREYAIPAVQWAAIADACHQRADAFGSRVEVAVALADLMPGTYEDTTVPARPVIDHRPYEHMLTVSRDATDEIAAACARCDQLGAYFGVDSSYYLNAVRTWQRAISSVFSMVHGATTRISRDGPLSLLVHTSSGFTYAVIFHPEPRRCINPGCNALINDAGDAYPPSSDAPCCPDDRHRPSYPLDAPQPGTWSVHS